MKISFKSQEEVKISEEQKKSILLGIKEDDEGKFISEEEADKIFEKCFK